MTIFNEIKYKNEQKKNRTAGEDARMTKSTDSKKQKEQRRREKKRQRDREMRTERVAPS